MARHNAPHAGRAASRRRRARCYLAGVSITDAGAHELNDWLSELLADPAKEYSQFEAGLALMPALAPSEVARLLRRRIDRLAIAISKTQAVLSNTRAKQVARLLTLDREYALVRLEAELAWLRQVATEIDSERLEGTTAWHG